MTKEDIRGKELIQFVKHREVIEQYKRILLNNGASCEDVYRNLNMYLRRERLPAEEISLDTYYIVDNALNISLRMDAIENRINQKYLHYAATSCEV